MYIKYCIYFHALCKIHAVLNLTIIKFIAIWLSITVKHDIEL